MILVNTPVKRSKYWRKSEKTSWSNLLWQQLPKQVLSVALDLICTMFWRKFWPFLFAELFQLSNVASDCCAVNGSLQVSSQHHCWMKVWALTGPHQRLEFYSSDSFCAGCTLMCMETVLLHHSTSTNIQLVATNLTKHYTEEYFKEIWEVIFHSMMTKCLSSEEAK